MHSSDVLWRSVDEKGDDLEVAQAAEISCLHDEAQGLHTTTKSLAFVSILHQHHQGVSVESSLSTLSRGVEHFACQYYTCETILEKVLYSTTSNFLWRNSSAKRTNGMTTKSLVGCQITSKRSCKCFDIKVHFTGFNPYVIMP